MRDVVRTVAAIRDLFLANSQFARNTRKTYHIVFPNPTHSSLRFCSRPAPGRLRKTRTARPENATDLAQQVVIGPLSSSSRPTHSVIRHTEWSTPTPSAVTRRPRQPRIPAASRADAGGLPRWSNSGAWCCQPEERGFKKRKNANLTVPPGLCGCTTQSDSKSKSSNGETCKSLPDSQAMAREDLGLASKAGTSRAPLPDART
jgi:hypothetical protein